MPTSKELLEMANTEWKNREERKGIHDKVSWTSGWINGYLTRNPQAERDTYKHISEQFFEWLDNIDTASDIAKGDDKLYRSLVSQEHKKRFKYANPDGSLMDIEELRKGGDRG